MISAGGTRATGQRANERRKAEKKLECGDRKTQGKRVCGESAQRLRHTRARGQERTKAKKRRACSDKVALYTRDPSVTLHSDRLQKQKPNDKKVRWSEEFNSSQFTDSKHLLC